MNKIYRVASATLMGVLLLLSLGSCSKESQLIPEGQPEAGAGQLAFSLDNDALRSVPAEAFEKAVDPDRVWCIFFTRSSSGALTFRVAKQAHKSSSGSNYSVNAGFAGAAQMFVVGNVEPDLQSQFYRLPSGTSLDEVQRLLVQNGLGSGSTEPAYFAMTSDLVTVTLPAVGAAPANILTPIVLKRLAARFDVINEVPGLQLSTVSVVNRVVTSTLLNVSQTGSLATTDYDVVDGKVLLHRIYSYQNSNKSGTQDATSFTIQGTYKGKTIKPISVKLQDATTSEALDVRRNHCYRIILKPTGDDFKPIQPDDHTTAWRIVVKVLDWHEASTYLANYSDEDLANLGYVDPTVNINGNNLLNTIAEYNLDITGTKLASSYSNKECISGYFTWQEAQELQMPEGYHLPTAEEWASVMGNDKSTRAAVRFDGRKTVKDVKVKVQLPNHSETIICKEDVKRVSADHATYMIRYKDDDTYRSAWCYSYVDSPIAGDEGKILKIESVTVNTKLTIEQLCKDYFAKTGVKEYVKTRYLPTTGCDYNRDGSGFTGFFRSEQGYYWSATEVSRDKSKAYLVLFDNRYASDYNTSHKKIRCVVRPFRNL